MPGTLTQEQFDNLVDIIGGLYGADAASTKPQPQETAAEPPAEGPAPPQPQVQLPAVPPAAPSAASPQAPQIPKSPYSGLWHKALPVPAPHFDRKSVRGRKPYQPTSSLAVKPTEAPHTKPTKAPPTATPRSLLYNRPYRPPQAQPFEPTQTARTAAPEDQGRLLKQVQQHVESMHGPDSGTNLAHILRTRQTDPSVASQYEALGIGSLEELAHLLNSAQGTTGINLDEFHDDLSPFVVISQPRQTLQEGGIPAVAVGLPYADQVHVLEQAFPSVHFFPAQEAPTELQRAAAQTAKPLPAKSLKALKQRYGKKDENTKPLPPSQAGPPTTLPYPDNPTPLKQPGQATPRPAAPRPQGTLPPPAEPAEPAEPAASAQAGTRPDIEAAQPARPVWEEIDPGQFSNTAEYLTHVRDAAQAAARERGYTSDQLVRIGNAAEDAALPIYKQHEQEQQRRQIVSDPMVTAAAVSSPLGQALRSGRVVNKTLSMAHTTNIGYMLDLEGAGGELRGYFKPAVGEVRGPLAVNRGMTQPRRGIPPHSFWKREFYYVYGARLLGLDQVVPTTVLRDVDGQVGSLQEWVDGTEVWQNYLAGTSEHRDTYATIDDDNLAHLAIMDYVFRASDRNQGNAQRKADGTVLAIDNGMSMSNLDLDMTFAGAVRASEFLRLAAYLRGLRVPNTSRWEKQWSALENMARKLRFEQSAIDLHRREFATAVQYSRRSFAELPAPDGSGRQLADWFPELEAKAREQWGL